MYDAKDMVVETLFEKLKHKDIICWGNGKHFRNLTYPFLCNSGLLSNLKGFLDVGGGGSLDFGGIHYGKITKRELADRIREKGAGQFLILVCVTGYPEVMNQIRRDEELSLVEAIPSIYLEGLYEDLCMLSAPKPPLSYRKNPVPVIPKVIHTFWFGDNEMPPVYRQCLSSWEKYAPNLEIRIWNQKTYHPGNCLFYEQAVQRKNWAFASDYARADVLRRYGGIYMDLDVEMLRPIDDLLYNDAYMSFESLTRIECGSGMGAKKGNRILEEICKSYEERPFIKEDGTEDLSTCPVRYTNVIQQHGLVKNGGFQQVEDITVYPFEVLTGKSFDTGITYRTEQSYTVHHHNGSWVPPTAKQALLQRYEEIRNFISCIS